MSETRKPRCGAVYHTPTGRYVCGLAPSHGGPHEDKSGPPVTYSWLPGGPVRTLHHAASYCRHCNRPLTEHPFPDCDVAGPGRIGVPRSRLGGLHPELAARLTAAEAAVADFRAEDEEYKREWRAGSNVPPDYTSHAYRLAAELHKITTFIRENQS